MKLKKREREKKMRGRSISIMKGDQSDIIVEGSLGG